jgi:cell division protein FtsL
VARINSVLLLLIIIAALSVITSQHKARKLFTELEVEQGTTQKLAEEWTQLQLEQSTWATHKRVEALASRQLGMRLPDASSTVIITADGSAMRSDKGAETKRAKP